MNRSDLQNLTQIRLNDATALLASGNYSGTYYISGYIISGYIVECALKACIAKLTNQYDFPDKKVADDSWTHDLEKLVRAANLATDLDRDRKANSRFDANWTIVKDWSERSRYRVYSQDEAQQLYDAIVDGTNGVLQWVQRFW